MVFPSCALLDGFAVAASRVCYMWQHVPNAKCQSAGWYLTGRTGGRVLVTGLWDPLTGADSNVAGWDAFNPLNIRWTKKTRETPSIPSESAPGSRTSLSPLTGFRYKYHPAAVGSGDIRAVRPPDRRTHGLITILHSPTGTDRSKSKYTVNRKKTWQYICDHNSEKIHSIFTIFASLQAGRNVLHTHVKYVHLT